jgi:type I restriction enzyme, S subunit
MAREWKTVSLESLYDFGSGLSKPREEFGFGHGFLSFKDVFHNYFVPLTLSQLVNSTEKEQQACSIIRGDVFLTRTSETMDELGMSCVALKNYEAATFNGFTKRLRPKANSGIVPEYAGYYFRSSKFRRDVTAMSSLSTRASLNNEMLARLTIDIPPVEVQTAIGSILKALDDKIELNRRMNTTLDAMARALFQSWFVNFDPVRAKLDGRSPAGLDEATAALFPASFQESSLGQIPHGWETTTLGKICEAGGGNIQTGPFGTQLHASDYVPEGVPSIMPSDLRDNRIDASTIARIREEDAKRLSAYRVQVGDVVYSRRGDVERRSLIRVAENGWLCGTGCLRVRFGARGLNPHFGAAYLGTSESRAWVVRHAVGATMPNLNTSILGALPMIVPPSKLQSRFAEIVSFWDELGTIKLEQSCTLATLRDSLLPQLLSGTLRINNLIGLHHD